MSDSGAGSTSRTRIIVAAVGLALIVAIGFVVVRLGSGSDDTGSTGSSADTSPSASPEPTDATPSDAPSPGAADEQSSGASSGASASASPGASRVDPGPVRVGFGRSAKPTKDLRVSVSRVEKVQSKAGLPGETSRPALRITVRVENLTDKTVPIGTALTNVYFGRDRSPASLVSRPGGKPFPAKVRPGSTATGVFVYNVPPRARDRVVLEVIVDAKARTVEFSGNCTAQC